MLLLKMTAHICLGGCLLEDRNMNAKLDVPGSVLDAELNELQ